MKCYSLRLQANLPKSKDVFVGLKSNYHNGININHISMTFKYLAQQILSFKSLNQQEAKIGLGFWYSGVILTINNSLN